MYVVMLILDVQIRLLESEYFDVPLPLPPNGF